MWKTNNLIKLLVLFLIGGFSYYGIEILWRGYSHISMFALGGICFVFIGSINEFFSWEMPLLKQGIIGSFIVTMLEFITGCIVNLWLNLDVWDYSDLSFNFMGQICLWFSLIWILLSIVAVIIDDWLRYWLFDEEKPHYKIM